MKEMIRKTRENDVGSLAVEYAIFLPIFIIGILTLTYILRIFYIQESLHQILCDESRTFAIESVILPEAASGVLLQYGIQTRAKEMKYGQDLKVRLQCESGLLDMENTLRMKASCVSGIPLPIQIKKGYSLENYIVMRKWVGEQGDGFPMAFSDMEKEQGGDLVFVFPRSGERYHKATCLLITNYPQEAILSGAIKRQYAPCKLCTPKEWMEGELIYCYKSSGSVYHRGQCNLVDKYFISLPKEDAEKRGYIKCKKC